MPRIPRLVVPGLPHHITQRGNRKQQTFFSEADYPLYINLMAKWCKENGVEIWSYCLMPNHVHLIAVPKTEGGLRKALGEAHRRYTLKINARFGWVGHLWQGRFSSFAMDETHLLNTMRYIELNPVRAGLAKQVGEWPYCSAAARLAGESDRLACVPQTLAIDDWHRFFATDTPDEQIESLRKHQRTGRPLGDLEFILQLEQMTGKVLQRQKPGPRPKLPAN